MFEQVRNLLVTSLKIDLLSLQKKMRLDVSLQHLPRAPERTPRTELEILWQVEILVRDREQAFRERRRNVGRPRIGSGGHGVGGVEIVSHADIMPQGSDTAVSARLDQGW